ncbi:MAG: hypothetical protein JXB00_18295 [Bacteroidales bacterium]|nr:hypothetical protein [Bacteroidales bacterium]
MNRTFISIIITFLFFSLYGQDLFNKPNSLNYAGYLFTAGEYSLAAREYERIIFLDSTNLQAKLSLIRSYRFEGNYQKGIDKTNLFFKEYPSIPKEVASDYGKMLLHEKQYTQASEFLNISNSLTQNEKVFFHLSGLMLQENYNEAGLYLASHAEPGDGYVTDYSKLLQLEKDFKYKKPGISIALSLVLPGSGKVYSGYWKDGLIAFVFVAANAYQSYRGFSKNGVESVYGWVFGGLATGFYIGNIYGSGKAANKRNKVFRHHLHHQVEEVFNSYY